MASCPVGLMVPKNPYGSSMSRAACAFERAQQKAKNVKAMKANAVVRLPSMENVGPSLVRISAFPSVCQNPSNARRVDRDAGWESLICLVTESRSGNALGRQAVLVDCTRVTRICCALMLWNARQARRASMRRLDLLTGVFIAQNHQ